jgi:hypothetical protein
MSRTVGHPAGSCGSTLKPVPVMRGWVAAGHLDDAGDTVFVPRVEDDVVLVSRIRLGRAPEHGLALVGEPVADLTRVRHFAFALAFNDKVGNLPVHTAREG